MSIYTVRKGDTLSGIAQRELGAASRWPEISDLNDLPNPDLIYPGQALKMPVSSGGLVSRIVDWLTRK